MKRGKGGKKQGEAQTKGEKYEDKFIPMIMAFREDNFFGFGDIYIRWDTAPSMQFAIWQFMQFKQNLSP